MIWMIAAAIAAQASPAAAMAASAAGWNKGDLAAFMAVYADDATYVTKQGVVRGKQAITARYAPTFTSGGNSRGRLTFQTLAERPLGPDRILLIARWTLTAVKTETGLTSLVFERRGRAWRIVADHGS